MTSGEADVCLNYKSEWLSPVKVRLTIDENSGGVRRGHCGIIGSWSGNTKF